jgi:hypothetical protein
VGSYLHAFLFVILPMESLNTGIHANAMETSSQGDLLIIGVHKKKEGGRYLGKKTYYSRLHMDKSIYHI